MTEPQKTEKKPKIKHTKYRPLKFRLPMIDSEREITLRVTKGMCQAAVRDDPGNCALALSAKASFRGLQKVNVLNSVAYFEFKTYVEKFYVKRPTTFQIKKFDKTGQFAPGDYHFGPMPPSQRRENQAKRNRTPRPRTGLQPKAGNRTAVKHMHPRGNLAIGWVTA